MKRFYNTLVKMVKLSNKFKKRFGSVEKKINDEVKIKSQVVTEMLKKIEEAENSDEISKDQLYQFWFDNFYPIFKYENIIPSHKSKENKPFHKGSRGVLSYMPFIPYFQSTGKLLKSIEDQIENKCFLTSGVCFVDQYKVLAGTRKQEPRNSIRYYLNNDDIEGPNKRSLGNIKIIDKNVVRVKHNSSLPAEFVPGVQYGVGNRVESFDIHLSSAYIIGEPDSWSSEEAKSFVDKHRLVWANYEEKKKQALKNRLGELGALNAEIATIINGKTQEERDNIQSIKDNITLLDAKITTEKGIIGLSNLNIKKQRNLKSDYNLLIKILEMTKTNQQLMIDRPLPQEKIQKLEDKSQLPTLENLSDLQILDNLEKSLVKSSFGTAATDKPGLIDAFQLYLKEDTSGMDFDTLVKSAKEYLSNTYGIDTNANLITSGWKSGARRSVIKQWKEKGTDRQNDILLVDTLVSASRFIDDKNNEENDIKEEKIVGTTLVPFRGSKITLKPIQRTNSMDEKLESDIKVEDSDINSKKLQYGQNVKTFNEVLLKKLITNVRKIKDPTLRTELLTIISIPGNEQKFIDTIFNFLETHNIAIIQSQLDSEITIRELALLRKKKLDGALKIANKSLKQQEKTLKNKRKNLKKQYAKYKTEEKQKIKDRAIESITFARAETDCLLYLTGRKKETLSKLLSKRALEHRGSKFRKWVQRFLPWELESAQDNYHKGLIIASMLLSMINNKDLQTEARQKLLETEDVSCDEIGKRKDNNMCIPLTFPDPNDSTEEEVELVWVTVRNETTSETQVEVESGKNYYYVTISDSVDAQMINTLEFPTKILYSQNNITISKHPRDCGFDNSIYGILSSKYRGTSLIRYYVEQSSSVKIPIDETMMCKVPDEENPSLVELENCIPPEGIATVLVFFMYFQLYIDVPEQIPPSLLAIHSFLVGLFKFIGNLMTEHNIIFKRLYGDSIWIKRLGKEYEPEGSFVFTDYDALGFVYGEEPLKGWTNVQVPVIQKMLEDKPDQEKLCMIPRIMFYDHDMQMRQDDLLHMLCGEEVINDPFTEGIRMKDFENEDSEYMEKDVGTYILTNLLLIANGYGPKKLITLFD